MTEQRLPTVNSDDGAWGDILNQYLKKEHYNGSADFTSASPNGGHQNITVQAGQTGVGKAPLKFTSGSLTTAAEVGAVEFLTDKLYYTTTGPSRKIIAAYDEGSPGATGDMYYRDSSGNFFRLAVGSNTYVLTSNGTTPTWAAPGGGSGLSQQQVMAISSMHM